jgi:hypothetical protein
LVFGGASAWWPERIPISGNRSAARRRSRLTGVAALAVAQPDRLAGYTAGELEVIAICETQAGRALSAREIDFQIAWAETVLGPGCEG